MIIWRNKALLSILLAAFAVTLFYAFYFQITPLADADAYDAIAKNLIAGYGYVENPNMDVVKDSAIGRVGPGYQFFLFFIYKIFGQDFKIVWFIQAILHVATGWIIFLICGKIFEEKGVQIGLLSAFLYLFFVDVLQMSAMIMTESLFLFFTVLSIYLFILYFYDPTKWNALWLGLAGSVCVLIRPTALIPLVVFLVFVCVRKHFWQAAIIALCFVSVIGPWTLRNYLVFDRFILTTAAGGYDIWVGNNLGASGELEPSKEITDYLNQYGVENADEKGMEEVKNFIFNHPFEFIKLQLIKTSIYFSAARPSAFWFHLSGASQILIIILSSLFAFVVFTFSLVGLWMFWKTDKPISRWLLVLTLTAPLSVIPIVVETRYRFPIYPYLVFFAGYALVLIIDKLKQKGNTSISAYGKILVVSLFLFSANTIFDVWRNFDLVKDKLGM